MMNRTPGVSAAVLVVLAVAPALAVDGVLEINQACATGPGCFSGDAPGFPVTLSASGSYRLTGNLNFNPALGPPTENFIEITGDDVRLDLNDFSIRCRNALSGELCPRGSVSGIVVSGSNVEIRHGSLVGMPHAGIRSTGFAEQARVTDLTVRSSGSTGIDVRAPARVEGCTVREAGGRGIWISDTAVKGLAEASVVTGNVVSGSGSDGIRVGNQSIVRDNVSARNQEAGFHVGDDSVVQGNTANFNGQEGFRLKSYLFTAGLARGNVATGNTGYGMDMGPSWAFSDNVLLDNNGGTGNAQTAGGDEGTNNFCNSTPGCPL
jgi:hypothetical protein